jgi:oligoribonuclease NrnB/cAMP/cGMP phosphodiesterase (DHH superfamily)
MTSLPQPEVILTHESDLDGLLSGLLLQRLAQKLFGVEVPLHAYPNHAWFQRNQGERSAWVADFAFEPRLDKAEWVIIDHHSYESTPRQATLIHDANKSAASLCYELCLQQGLGSPALDRLVQLNNVADLFLVSDPDFTLACDYANLVKTYQFWNLETLVAGDPERLLNHPLLEVMAVKRRVEDPIGLAWSRDNITPITPTVGLVQTVVGNTNQIVFQLLEEQAIPYTVLLTLTRRGKSPMMVSLRSRNGEALRIAEKLRGGGHPNACGAMLPRSVQSVSDAVLYLRQVLDPKLRNVQPASSLEEIFASLEQEGR